MAHLTHEELKGYEAGTLANSALVVADRHLADCAVCRYELRRAASAAPALPSFVMEMGEPVHLTYEEMTAYVDAKIDDAARERMNEHAAICKSCSKELRDLQVFDARMNVEMNTVPAAQAETGPSWLKQAIGERGAVFWYSATAEICGSRAWIDAAGRVQPVACADEGRRGAVGFGCDGAGDAAIGFDAS